MAGHLLIPCGIVGFGRIGRLIAEILSDRVIPLELVGIADPKSGPSSASARWYADAKELVQSPAVEAVVIATPPARHYDLAGEALRAGKDVLLEKPPVRTAREAEELIRAAAEIDRVLFFAYHAQFNPGVQRARSLLSSEEIFRVDVRYKENALNFHPRGGWVFDEGVLRDSGIVVFSVLNALLGDDADLQVVSGTVDVPQGRRAPTRASLELVYRGGRPILVEMDWEFAGPEVRVFELSTRHGISSIDITRGVFLVDGIEETGPSSGRDMLRLEYAAMLADWHEHLRTRRSRCGLKEIELLEEAATKCRVRRTP